MGTPRVAPTKVRSGYHNPPGAWLKKIMSAPPSPERTTQLVDKLEGDINRFPFAAAEMPPEIADAHEAFCEAVQAARGAAEAVTQAGAATAEAAETDVRATADALKAGAKTPPLRRVKARAAEEAAVVALEASERLVSEAHIALTDAIRDNWPTWRRLLVAAADTEHAAAVRLLNEARAATERRRLGYVAVLALDGQVVARYPEIGAEVDAQSRQGLPIFEAAVRAYLPNGWNAATVANLEQNFGALRAHLGEPVPWAHEWCPPDDPEFASLMQRALDTDAGWVRSFAFDGNQPYCADCGRRLPPNTPLDPETLKPIHEGCQGHPAIENVPACYRIG